MREGYRPYTAIPRSYKLNTAKAPKKESGGIPTPAPYRPEPPPRTPSWLAAPKSARPSPESAGIPTPKRPFGAGSRDAAGGQFGERS